MKSFVIACVVAIVIAAISGVVLSSFQQTADKAFTTTSVRLDA